MTDTTTRPATTVALDIGGMTCASCAARITKRLNKLDGVDASVNYATEQATVTLPDGLTVDDVVAQVEAIGYTATVPAAAQPDTADDDEGARETDPELTALRNRLIVAAVFGIPVLLISMINTLQFDELAMAHVHAWPPRSSCGRRTRSTGPPGRTCATAPPPWTPSSRSARSPRSAGASTPCSGVRPGSPA